MRENWERAISQKSREDGDLKRYPKTHNASILESTMLYDSLRSNLYYFCNQKNIFLKGKRQTCLNMQELKEYSIYEPLRKLLDDQIK